MADRPRKPFNPGHYQTPQTPRDPEKPEHSKRDRYDWLMLWITGGGVLVACIVTGISWSQTRIMKEEVVAGLRQQRAWIRVDVSDPSLYFEKDGAVGMLSKVKLTNVGTIPSNYVRLNSNLTPVASLEEAVERGGFIKCPPFHLGRGDTLFPNESATADEYASNMIEITAPARTVARATFIFTVCAYYDSGQGDLRGLTTARYYLTPRLAADGDGFVVTPGEVSTDRIALNRYFDVEPAQ